MKFRSIKESEVWLDLLRSRVLSPSSWDGSAIDFADDVLEEYRERMEYIEKNPQTEEVKNENNT